MTNTSATGGYMVPTSQPQPDKELVRLIQQMVAGITGLPGSLVRPRWQKKPPTQPEAEVNWCAVGITHATPDANAYVRHSTTLAGHDELTRHEALNVLCSFYGPDCFMYAGVLRDGLALSQNRAALRRVGMAVAYTGDTANAPALINLQWLARADLSLVLRREVRRIYPILNFIRLPAVSTTDTGLTLQLGCPPEE